jgi:hypothetical protein
VETLRLTLLFLHLVGLAVLLGSFLVQLRGERRITGVLLTGAIIMAVTGPSLVVVRRSLDLPVLDAKLATKAAIVALIAVVAIIGWMLERRPAWAYYTVGLFTLANLAVAVFWR